jgi:hypothetical protein
MQADKLRASWRRRGHRGGQIPMHRAIDRLHLPWQRLAGGAVLALAYSVLLAGLRPWVAASWAGQIGWWLQALQLPGQLDAAVAVPLLGNPGAMPLPRLELALPEPTTQRIGLHGLGVLAVWVAAGWLPDAAKPGAYVLRFAALLHGAAVLYFVGWAGSFPHSASTHVMGGLQQSWALMLVVPWLHLLTYHLFPFPAWQGMALTALSLLFLAVLAPLQYASHMALLAWAGPILMPLLFLLFGLMLPVLGLVALYGWAMSWHGADRPEEAR